MPAALAWIRSYGTAGAFPVGRPAAAGARNRKSLDSEAKAVEPEGPPRADSLEGETCAEDARSGAAAEVAAEPDVWVPRKGREPGMRPGGTSPPNRSRPKLEIMRTRCAHAPGDGCVRSRGSSTKRMERTNVR